MNAALSEDTAGWPPEQTVFAVPTIELRVLPGEHPVRLRHLDAIEANWDQEIAANPMLYDGRMVLQHRMSIDPSGITGEAYVVPFSTFLWWRKQMGQGTGMHVFAYPVIASSDGALIAIRMGEHTANPGSVYFAAGSLDEHDIFDGRCDVDRNMAREVSEETGLDLGEAVPEGGYHGVCSGRTVTLFRVFRFARTAEELVAAIERHMVETDDQEISAAVTIRSADPAAQPYHGAMPRILTWFFEERS